MKMTLRVDYIGTKRFFKDGLLHNSYGPALEFTDGHKAWFINGQRHNAYGPSVIWPGGMKQWYIFGKEYTEKDYKKRVRKLMSKYFRIWFQKCDRPGTLIFENRANESYDLFLEIIKEGNLS